MILYIGGPAFAAYYYAGPPPYPHPHAWEGRVGGRAALRPGQKMAYHKGRFGSAAGAKNDLPLYGVGFARNFGG